MTVCFIFIYIYLVYLDRQFATSGVQESCMEYSACSLGDVHPPHPPLTTTVPHPVTLYHPPHDCCASQYHDSNDTTASMV